MGTIKKGILGGFSGKVGTVVGANWRGIDYIRSLPASVRNPKTPGQVTQRSKFSMTVNLLSQITPLLRIGFKNYEGKQTAYNAATSYNVMNAFTGSGETLEMDYSKVLISRGKLMGVSTGDAQVVENDIILTWDTSLIGNAAAKDKTLILFYNTTLSDAKYFVDENNRAEGGFMTAVPENWVDSEVECYVGFFSLETGDVSNSNYLGKVVIPAV